MPNFKLKNIKLVCHSIEPESTCYAKALASCTLHKTEALSDASEDVLFIVPESYFVAIVRELNESVLQVRYDRFVGYVSASTIKRVSFVPKQQTLIGVTLDIKSSSGTQIWSSPSTAGEALYLIERGARGINYIAQVFGELLSGGQSNLWYFVSYTPPESPTDVYTGYIYSQNTTNLSEIAINTECDPEPVQAGAPTLSEEIYLNSPIKTIIVTLVAVPIILLLAILLYRLVKHIRAARAAESEAYYMADTASQNSYFPENLHRRRPKLADRLKNFGKMTFVKRSNDTNSFSSRQSDESNYSAGYPQKYLIGNGYSSSNIDSPKPREQEAFFGSNFSQNNTEFNAQKTANFSSNYYARNTEKNSSIKSADFTLKNNSESAADFPREKDYDLNRERSSNFSRQSPAKSANSRLAKLKSKRYPPFPDYESEDDLL